MVLQWINGGLTELQLDIVGFLAILGEGSVLANAQVASLSRWMFTPRLIPAPQALLRTSRPSKLDPTPGWVNGVRSGNHRTYIQHIGNIVVEAENLPQFSVRCVEIVRDSKVPEYKDVKSKVVAPLTLLVLLGLALSIALLVLSIHYKDAMALMATILLSSLSTVVGLGNKWKLQLPKRNRDANVPPGDVVIRYPKGNFLVVKCHENVARELYFAPESIEYMVEKPAIYRLISLVGTIMLMFGVIFLGNAKIEMQICFAGAYMVLNAAYWIVAALPAKLHWDTKCYIVKNHLISNNQNIGKNESCINITFTQALWKAIVLTKHTDWVRISDAAPNTPAWNEWLREAQEQARTEDFPENKSVNEEGTTIWTIPSWDPQQRLNDLMSLYNADDNDDKISVNA